MVDIPAHRNPWVHFTLSLIALSIALIYLNHGHGPQPPVGPLLSPFHGIWNHRVSFWEESHAIAGQGSPFKLNISGLHAPVTVVVDQDQIKHVFAQDDEDLYMAQGYILASERLWEMEFLSRITGGRLSEIMGKRTLEFDKYFVKLGVPQAAKESADLMLNDPLTGPALRSYSAGVNAYINTLEPDYYPFEYKLLNLTPEKWAPSNAAYLLKFMAYSLAGHNRELQLSRSRSRVSKDDFDTLFPLDLNLDRPNLEPIVPKGTKFSFDSRAPEIPKTEFLPDLKALEPVPQPHPSNGSNNWAVMGKKSVTGKPILSNDIHLSLSLPSLWYQMQLVSPTQNVYGIALPGAPGIILGFNAKLAWGVTNGGSDVMDWYQLRFRDQARSEYLFDEIWRPVISREVEIKVRNDTPVQLLLRQTHLGPIVYDQSETPLNASTPNGLAVKWGVLEPSNELKSFMLLNRAKSTAQCREAIENFQTPDQNFLCADQSGDVGIWHMGRFPIRFPGQGRMISDGSSSKYEWHGWLPRNEVPSSRNPERGFLSSANQVPADTRYPHYLGWPFEAPFRAERMNEILREKRKFSADDLRSMQGDTLSVLARTATPLLLGAIKQDQLSDAEAEAVRILTGWDYRYSADSEAASIFESWFTAFETHLWTPHFTDPRLYQFPTIPRTLRLMKEDPTSKFFDNPATPETEHFHEVALASLKDAIRQNQSRFGSLKSGGWKWSRFQPTTFDHISKIPGLGVKILNAGGVGEALFANKGDHGPVWKMVASVGANPKVWAIYPGGQSGDPASKHYDDFLDSWRRNDLREIIYLKSPSDLNPRLLQTIGIENKP